MDNKVISDSADKQRVMSLIHMAENGNRQSYTRHLLYGGGDITAENGKHRKKYHGEYVGWDLTNIDLVPWKPHA